LMKEKYVCPVCGNEDSRYIGYSNGSPYCRLCLPFSGKKADRDFKVKENIKLELSYPLSEKQEIVAKKVKELLINKRNVLIHAVTGAGKTELVYYSMAYYLKTGLHVGFATPRRDVVVDLQPRIKEAFPSARVISVYGSHSTVIEGDIIVLTTHQLYRYPSYFDLLILDEIDAFPYKDNFLLKSFFRRSVKGNYVLLSATPSRKDIEEVKADSGEVVTLFERYHKAKMPVPQFVKTGPYSIYVRTLRYLKKYEEESKPVFVFTPTISEGKRLFGFLSFFFHNGSFVSSKEEERKIDIQKFKNHQFSFLVTTSILERGVTVRDLQVIVFNADHALYTQAALVQIAGRVGRKIGATSGDVIFLAEEENDCQIGAIEEIEKYNQSLEVL